LDVCRVLVPQVRDYGIFVLGPDGILNFNAGSARKTVVAMGAKDENEALPAFKVLNDEEFAALSGREKMAYVSRAIEAIHDGKNSATLRVAVGQPG